MTAATATPLVSEFGTGLLHTRVSRLPGGRYQWWRATGPYAPAPFAPRDRALTARLAAVRTRAGHRLLLGQPMAGGRQYAAAGARSVAHELLDEGPRAGVEATLYGLGQLLAAMHAQPRPAGARRPGRAMSRLTMWLDGQAPRPAAARAAGQLRQRLDNRRWTTLRQWCTEALADPEVVLAHGAPSLGSLVATEDGNAELLTGEDVCTTPWYIDLAWPAGELVELRWFRGGAGQHPPWQALLDALYAGYGRDLGPHWPGRIGLRIALHLHDFTAYVGWSGHEVERYSVLLERLIDIAH